MKGKEENKEKRSWETVELNKRTRALKNKVRFNHQLRYYPKYATSLVTDALKKKNIVLSSYSSFVINASLYE